MTDPPEDLAARLISKDHQPGCDGGQPEAAESNLQQASKNELEEDYNSRLLANDFFQDTVYNDCTVPIEDSNSSIFAKTSQITACFIPLASTSNLHTDAGPTQAGVEPGQEEASILPGPGREAGLGSEPRVRFTNSGDMFQSLNNLRINVNNHIVGGSKSVMGQLRANLGRLKLQDKHRRPALQLALALLIALLILYVMYRSQF